MKDRVCCKIQVGRERGKRQQLSVPRKKGSYETKGQCWIPENK